jgi:hypothetical protein
MLVHIAVTEEFSGNVTKFLKTHRSSVNKAASLSI